MSFYDSAEDIERAELYRLFASIFMNEPSDELIFHVKEVFDLKFSETPQQIRMDFVDLFLRHDLHLAPYESLYNYPIGAKPKLWGKAAEDVQAFYSAAGLILDEEINFMPDHISSEMLFMSYLIEKGVLEAQKKFFERHLVKWIPEYCDMIENHAGTFFYKVVANILKEFLLSEVEKFETIGD